MSSYYENPRRSNPESRKNTIEVTQSSMDYLKKIEADLNTLNNWLISSRETVEKLGKAHLSGNMEKRRFEQNELWESFRKEIWSKKLFFEAENFTDTEEKRMLMEKIKKLLTFSSPDGKNEQTTNISPDKIRTSLFNQLLQHWLALDYVIKEPEKVRQKTLEEFVFRISLWLSDIPRIKHATTELINQCQIKPS